MRLYGYEVIRLLEFYGYWGYETVEQNLAIRILHTCNSIITVKPHNRNPITV